MKKIDPNRTLQFLGYAGVMAGIVFLAYELRQNTQAIQQDSAQFMASEQASFYRQLVKE